LSGSVKIDDPVGASGQHESFRAHRFGLHHEACARTINQHGIGCQQVGNLVLKESCCLRDCGDSRGAVAGLQSNEVLAQISLAFGD